MSRPIISNLLGLLGAAVGGGLGFILFGQLLKVNLYGLILPGALLGLGCNALARHPSTIRGIVCALGALVLSLAAEWFFRPFAADSSLSFFLTHLSDLNQGWYAYAMIVLGVGFAFWWGRDYHLWAAGTPRPSRSGPVDRG